MRKVILSLLITGLLLAGIFPPAEAQDNNLEFNLNVGALTDSSFGGVLFTFGTGLDFHLGERIMISPELQLWNYNFSFAILLSPGFIMNLKVKNFFVGGGVILPLSISGEEKIEIGNRDIESGYLMPKINAGLRINRIKLTLYLITSFNELNEGIVLGANIGFVF